MSVLPLVEQAASDFKRSTALSHLNTTLTFQVSPSEMHVHAIFSNGVHKYTALIACLNWIAKHAPHYISQSWAVWSSHGYIG